MKMNLSISLAAAAALCLAWAPARAAGDGKALFESKCTLCHDASRSLSASKDRAGWLKTIERMKGKGARVTEAEAAEIADHLVKAAGK